MIYNLKAHQNTVAPNKFVIISASKITNEMKIWQSKLY